MKKIISIALALVMMFAICVPAFAADKTITNTAPDAQDAVIKTSTTGATGSYTVTIPAETVIAWGTESTNLQYKVSAQLEPNKALKVTAAAKDGVYTMTDANGLTLAYTLGDATYTTTANTVVTDEAKTLTVNVAANDWNNAVISEYSGYLTFTAEVVTA